MTGIVDIALVHLYRKYLIHFPLNIMSHVILLEVKGSIKQVEIQDGSVIVLNEESRTRKWIFKIFKAWLIDWFISYLLEWTIHTNKRCQLAFISLNIWVLILNIIYIVQKWALEVILKLNDHSLIHFYQLISQVSCYFNCILFSNHIIHSLGVNDYIGFSLLD